MKTHTASADRRPLVAHVVHRFDVGGMENGVVNLINRMRHEAYRHAVIALTEVTDFRARIVRDDVDFISLHKPPGHAFWIYPQLFRLFRALRPAIVHTRNLGTLEVAVAASAAGVPVRIHGEHGWDVGDIGGANRKYQWVRRAYRPFVTKYIVLSGELERYLTDKVGVPSARLRKICNGVDAERFHPAPARTHVDGWPFAEPRAWVIGTVGRMQPVKDQTTLTRAFIRALELAPELKGRLRLVMVGDGPLREASRRLLENAGVSPLAWLPGERDDVHDLLRSLDCFVLPSLAEGISNTILEAMACGVPVIATEVGGSPELVEAGVTGELVPAADVETMAQAIVRYARHPELARQAGRAGRQSVERRFSLEAMVRNYQQLYDELLGRE
ncbi:TIGR03088 family PEP-CTERM/XrtA system glycosyltransferase [Propionivibrio limicola]|uniref:TIGR03088 family PEP-CTERM/XrtA system glycosyltransferase n=1 Tax=Propionivibrio limicola TaxID=167645 RepID=UPI0012923630|nr:TIGR03088 family PEP-CTERM/XrtA system glycosyltransferase [Propionivibrio limicola]